MDSDIYLNLLWFIPVIAWFAMRAKSITLRSTVTGAIFGLIITHASFGLYALYLAWPVSDAFGQFGFYSGYIHVKAGVIVAIFLHLISDNIPISDDQRLLIGTVNSVSWAIVYGALGFMMGYVKSRWKDNQ